MKNNIRISIHFSALINTVDEIPGKVNNMEGIEKELISLY